MIVVRCIAAGSLLLVAGCAPGGAEVSGDAGERLAPTFAADPRPGNADRRSADADRGGVRGTKRPQAQPEPDRGQRSRAPGGDPSAGSGSSTATPAPSPTMRPTPAGPLAGTLSDATGDVRGSLTSPPAYVDLAGARLTRGADAWELVVEMAGTVPARASDDRVVNVVAYFDTDRDGVVDYQVLAHLSDAGWSGSYRHPSGSRFGADSGVTITPQARYLVVRFPPGHLAGARSQTWGLAAEWGTVEELALGQGVRDHAPDSGGATFPD